MGSQSSKVSEGDAERRNQPAATHKEETNKEVEEDEEEEEDEDVVDDWDKRIFSTGCAEENDRMRDCHFEKKDWRLCIEEMEQFKRCWKAHGNEERTSQKDL